MNSTFPSFRPTSAATGFNQYREMERDLVEVWMSRVASKQKVFEQDLRSARGLVRWRTLTKITPAAPPIPSEATKLVDLFVLLQGCGG